jgi:hypothetical protein
MLHGIHRVNELDRAGMTRRDIDALRRVGDLRGIRTSGPPSDARLERVRAAATVAPAGAVLAGWGAAVVHGVPHEMLDGTWDGNSMIPVPFIVPMRSGLQARRGLTLWKGPLADGDVVTIGGTPVTSGDRTIADLARWSRHPARALAMVDIGVRHGLVDSVRFPQYLQTMKGFRGIRYAREAAKASSGRAESPRESELRYFWLEAGLPEPLVNAEIFDLRGRFMGRVDLLEPKSGYVGEYDGHWHQMGDRPALDARRNQGLVSLNLTMDVFGDGDFHGARFGALTGRLMSGWRRAQGRDARHDAWFCPPYQR